MVSALGERRGEEKKNHTFEQFVSFLKKSRDWQSSESDLFDRDDDFRMRKQKGELSEIDGVCKSHFGFRSEQEAYMVVNSLEKAGRKLKAVSICLLLFLDCTETARGESFILSFFFWFADAWQRRLHVQCHHCPD
jgi:hypothetical protein